MQCLCLSSRISCHYNPDGNPGQTPDLAFNTAISFLVNCNLQHYSGESGLTYLTQLFVILLSFNFSAQRRVLPALVALFNGLKEKTTNNLGNFWNYLVKSTTRILLPLSIIVAIILAFNGTPTSYDGKGQHCYLTRRQCAGIKRTCCRNDRY